MTGKQTLIFVLPSTGDLVSGGNIYNQNLIAALRADDRLVIEIAAPEQWRSLVDSGKSGVFIFDTLLLDQLAADMPRPKQDQQFVLLTHHLPSLEPGLPPDHASLAVERSTLPAFDAYLVTSHYAASVLEQRDLGRPILTVPPALADEHKPPLSFPAIIRGLMVCNLIPRKAVAAFLETLAERVRDDDNFAIDIVGHTDLDVDYGEQCRAIIERSPVLGRLVSLRGPTAHGSMHSWYENASVFLSASLMETYGMALQEARAFGLPILACRGGNSENHVAEGAGLVYDSPQALAVGFVELARDRDGLRELFDEAQAVRSQDTYTWTVAASDLIETLRQLR